MQRLKMATSLNAANAIRADLSAKFGRPSKESATDWLDNRNGDRGMIEIFDMAVLRQVWDYDKRQPAQRKM